MKLLKTFVLNFIIVILFLFCFNYFKSNSIFTKESLSNSDLKIENKQESKEYKNAILDEFNIRNNKIKNIKYEKITIKANGFSTKSSFLYEKDKKLRMLTNSAFGKESDVGSNDVYFWFWSGRLKKNTLFYAKHEDLDKTRLKTIFHPTWMMETIGIDNLEYKENEIFEKNGYLGVKKNKTDVTNGEPIKRVYLIDVNKKAYYGHYLYDKNDNMVVSFEIVDYYKIEDFYCPKEINVNWQKEKLKLKWELSKPILNSNINKENWAIPVKFKNKIDLNGYCPD